MSTRLLRNAIAAAFATGALVGCGIQELHPPSFLNAPVSGVAANSGGRITLALDVQRPGSDLLSVIRAERPLWLSQRGSEARVAVYVDGMRLGGPEELRGFEVTHVRALEYIDGRNATTRFGLNHGNGAILIYLKP